MISKETSDKEAQLKLLLQKILNKGPTAVAFSGGVDSSLLLKELTLEVKDPQSQIFPIYLKSTLNPKEDLELCEQFCQSLKLKLNVVEQDELINEEIVNNPPNRCYLCKKDLFLKLKEKAQALNCQSILDGTNDDDRFQFRPGLKALSELGILSPLGLCGLKKAEIRSLASILNLKVSHKPSSPCLATRFAYGEKLSKKRLESVALCENFLKELGFYNVRVRVHQDLARIELDLKSLNEALKLNERIVPFFKTQGFLYVTLDLEGFRSGSFDLKQKAYDFKIPFDLKPFS